MFEGRYRLTWEAVWLTVGYGLGSLIAFVPLIFSSQLIFGTVSIKGFVFRILVELLFLVYTLLVLEHRKYAPKNSLLLWLLIALFIALTVSSLLNGTIIYSFWGNLVRMDGLISLGHLIIYFLVLSNMLKNFRSWHRILQTFVFVGLVISFIALSQNLGQSLVIASGGDTRATGTLGNADYLGFYLSLTFFLTLFLLTEQKIRDSAAFTNLMLIASLTLLVIETGSRLFYGSAGPLSFFSNNLYLAAIWVIISFYSLSYYLKGERARYYILWSATALTQFLAIVASGAKASLLAVFVGLIVFSFQVLGHRFSQRPQWQVAGWLGLVAVFLLIGWLLFGSPGLRNSVRVSLESRTLVWQSAIQASTKKIWLGWGKENFDLAFDANFPISLYQTNDSRVWFDKAHNEFFQTLVEGGTLALSFYLLIWLVIVLRARRWSRLEPDRNIFAALSGLASCYFINAFFYFETISSSLVILTIIGLIDNRSRQIEEQPSKPAKILFLYNLFRWPVVLPVLMTIMTILFILNFNWRPLQANYRFTQKIRAIETGQADLSEQSAAELDSLLTINPSLGKQEEREYFGQVIRRFLLDAPGSVNPQIIRLAEGHLLKNTLKRPLSVRPYIDLANLYVLAASQDPEATAKGAQVTEQALKLSPNRTQLLYLLGHFLIRQSRPEEGLAALELAMRRQPTVFETYWRYYVELLDLQRQEQAKAFYSQALLPAYERYGQPQDRALLELIGAAPATSSS